jgi:hypothetical protein
MATVGAGNPTLVDVAKRLDPDGGIAAIAELLDDSNPIVQDMILMEGNLPTGHRLTIRSGLPSATWRLLNYGVQPSKSRTVQVDDACGMLEAYAEVDKDLAMLNGNTAEFRLSEDKAFIEAMGQELASTLFYGNTDTDPEEFLGLSARYAVTGTDPDVSSYNTILSDGAGSDNTSVWLIVWDTDKCFGIYPKGSTAGLQHQDLGEVTLEDAAGGLYQGFRSHYQWKIGLSIKDWRYVVRLANIDVSNLTIDAATGTDLYTQMVTMYHRLPNLQAANAKWYCNSTVSEYLHHQARNNTQVQMTVRDVEGEPKLSVLGRPVTVCDAILNTESLAV